MSDQYRTIVGIAHASHAVQIQIRQNAIEPFQAQLQGLGIVK